MTKSRLRNTRDPPERGDVNLPAPSGKPILYKQRVAAGVYLSEAPFPPTFLFGGVVEIS